MPLLVSRLEIVDRAGGGVVLDAGGNDLRDVPCELHAWLEVRTTAGVGPLERRCDNRVDRQVQPSVFVFQNRPDFERAGVGFELRALEADLEAKADVEEKIRRLAKPHARPDACADDVGALARHVGRGHEVTGALEVIREAVRDLERGMRLTVKRKLARRRLHCPGGEMVRMHFDHRPALRDGEIWVNLDFEEVLSGGAGSGRQGQEANSDCERPRDWRHVKAYDAPPALISQPRTRGPISATSASIGCHLYDRSGRADNTTCPTSGIAERCAPGGGTLGSPRSVARAACA